MARVHGIYCDGNTTGVNVYDNTCFNNSNSGIWLGSNGEITVTGNTCYNNMYQIRGADGERNYTNMVVKNNIFFARDSIQLVSAFNVSNSSLSAMAIDNNYYCRPVREPDNINGVIGYSTYNSIDGAAGFNWQTYNDGGVIQSFGYYSLDKWKLLTGKDANSSKTPITFTDTSRIKFEYNPTKLNKSILLNANYIDATGKTYSGTISLAPFTSIVLIKIGVSNIPPVSNAGSDQTITLPTNSINLSGSGTDPDGTIVSYEWTKISGPAAGTITNATSATTTVTGLVQGVYQFELKVTDNNGATGKDTIQVTVNAAANIPPTANAGTDQTITLPTNTVSLNGSGTDPDGTIASL